MIGPATSVRGSIADFARDDVTRKVGVTPGGTEPLRNRMAARPWSPGASVPGTTATGLDATAAPPSALVTAPRTRTFVTGWSVPFSTITATVSAVGAPAATTATVPAGTGVESRRRVTRDIARWPPAGATVSTA